MRVAYLASAVLWLLLVGSHPAALAQSALAMAEDAPGGDSGRDGRTNAQEVSEGTHPKGFVKRYLAEGATGAFFDTRLALLNPSETADTAVVISSRGGGMQIVQRVPMAPRSRATLDADRIAGLENTSFSVTVESEVGVVVDRTMRWDAGGYASHAETGVSGPLRGVNYSRRAH